MKIRKNRFLVIHRLLESGACSDARLAFLCPYFSEINQDLVEATDLLPLVTFYLLIVHFFLQRL